MNVELHEHLDLSDMLATPLFAGVPADEVLAVARHGTWEFVPPAIPIIEEWDEGDRFYVIAEGTAEVVTGSGDAETRLALLTVGDHFGEMALVFDHPCMASVRSLTAMKLLMMDAVAFYDVLSTTPHLRERVARSTYQRMAANQQTGPQPAP